MVVFNDGRMITDPADDQYKVLTSYEGQGNLPSLDVFSIAEDNDNEESNGHRERRGRFL